MSKSDMNKIVARNILRLLEEKDENQRDLANALNVSPSTVSSWCTGEKMPRMDKVDAMAEHFGTTRMALLSAFSPLPSNVTQVDLAKLKRIPILGRIACGRPILAQENIEGYTYTDLNGGAEYFALRVSGDSMNAARINEGDIVIVRQQDTVDNGQIAVVMVGDEDATLKRWRQDGRTITLSPQSTNPDNQPIVLDAAVDAFRILGLVVRVEFSPI